MEIMINSIQIKNFRSIKDQIINDVDNALILVGKNNGGKSSLINALRLFWGDYIPKPEDFHKNSELIEVNVDFNMKEEYLINFIFHPKIGLSKIPSSANEFNSIKEGTYFEDVNFNDFKNSRNEILQNVTDVNSLIKDYNYIIIFWIKAIKNKFSISNNQLIIKMQINKNELKTSYFDKDNNSCKDIIELLPQLAFIDDDRNFSEEEVGKSKTITNFLFGNYILKQSRNEDITCNNCLKDNCMECMDIIYKKRIGDLTLTDLEKLLKNSIENKCNEISSEISKLFCKNYKNDYQVCIDPKSNVDSSFSISTKIFDPNLNKKIDLSNVGAGVRSIYILSLLEAYYKISKSNNIIFLIEEPEIYLHPSLQKLMAKTLHEIAQENQIIFSTHSPLMLKNFETKQVKKVFLNNDNETIITSTNLDGVLNELGYSTGDFLHTDFTIFLEGPDDKERLIKIIERFYNIDIKKITFIDTKSCRNIEIYATLRFLNKTVMKDDFIIIRDSDTKDINEIKNKLLNSFHENLGSDCSEKLEQNILILTYSSLENYFLDPHILISLNVIRDLNDYYSKIEKYINNNKERIIEYLKKQNDTERATSLENIIFKDCNIEDKIEDIKKYVRGHDLFGIFGELKTKIEDYIAYSTRDIFKEILNFLDKHSYFASRKKL